ncbi:MULTISPECIES: epoxyqueuosine reductase QueH [unclassified Enterococcus]|uniref:epoxyqueuosine reductase QueH n=1 Tax=unclassified Enterococcus TaxID=2608891 RepID=UPI00155213E1|nr:MULTISPECIES: epoxyqueuosine reductase QueH [unclassified Enterococcus]MBS7578107.1 epoxyqueuosine reductase QueH [Enterococcus sp. MMGLQ5-2]MBS7585367.1 epoxyqueuosine reductase QueH [Enterococcus sp. MMGLQ5-1]NPD13224.1 epoxyqueuosine reductase QueH [Enterococcus sp. MMGLQ5-1]NPD37938.1 epoxyqueuosine reductase QueH [Enterococcus sp. MMGLQ5-2]
MINSLEILKKFKPNQKINYDYVLKKMIDTWQKATIRPKILLHSCCAPCSTYTLEYLTQFADITIYFANSNIHPRSEYLRRETVQKQFINEFNQQTAQNVQFIAAPYEPQKFVRMVKERGLESAPEGGARCQACFQMRLDLVAEKAQELGYDYFGSALTISPHKNSKVINEVGIEVQEFYDVSYLPSDFKKNNGYRRSIEMCEAYHIYRQCYCGCLFAAQQMTIDLKQIAKEADLFNQQLLQTNSESNNAR